MLSTEQILEGAAHDGTIDITEWPRVLETVLQRLKDIVYNDFPLPTIPLPTSQPPVIDPEVVALTPPHGATSDPAPTELDLPDADDSELPLNSQSSTKENDVPSDLAVQSAGLSGFGINHSDPHGQAPEPPDQTLPSDLYRLYQTSRQILEYDFAHSPPYTIQRLAELVLRPKKHYRFLPAFLRALDRIVSVSSPLTDFPLSRLNPSSTGGSFLTNGDSSQINGIPDRADLGSDESLGGALLTPIPWLKRDNLALGTSTASNSHDGELHHERTETTEGPNGAGSIETVSVTVNGVPSVSSVLVRSPPIVTSPTLSEQSDASTSSSIDSTEASLRQQGGLTQGELLRQEQKAGVIPAPQTSPHRTGVSGNIAATAISHETAAMPMFAPHDAATDVAMDEDGREEYPHARGPEEIGMEDVGPQPIGGDGPDLSAAWGRERSPPLQAGAMAGMDALTANPQAESLADARTDWPGGDSQNVEEDVERLKEAMDAEKEADARDADGDVAVADADGRRADVR